MSYEISEIHIGFCPTFNSKHSIEVTFLQKLGFENYERQKQYFECDNINCEHFKSRKCPIYQEIPFVSKK